jgi:hypothetical protein
METEANAGGDGRRSFTHVDPELTLHLFSSAEVPVEMTQTAYNLTAESGFSDGSRLPSESPLQDVSSAQNSIEVQ